MNDKYLYYEAHITRISIMHCVTLTR